MSTDVAPAAATAIEFADHFWGERHIGFSVMYQNMKSGQQAVKEMQEFLKDRIQADEEHNKSVSRSFNKVSTFASASSPHNFTKAWTLAKNTMERVQQTRTTLVQALQEIEKEVRKYNDELQKSQRKLKEQETFDAVNLMQTTTTCLQKAKESYAGRFVELHKLRQDETSTPKELGKAEGKLTKAREEYKQYIEKYEKVRTAFESKVEVSANHFQTHEIAHLLKMKSLLAAVAKHIEESHNVQSQIYNEFRFAVENLSAVEILATFVAEKSTGSTRPPKAVFEEPDVEGAMPPPLGVSSLKAPANASAKDVDAHSNDSGASRSKSGSTQSGLPAAVDSVYDLLNVNVPAPSNGAIDNLIHLSPEQEQPPPLPTSPVPELGAAVNGGEVEAEAEPVQLADQSTVKSPTAGLELLRSDVPADNATSTSTSVSNVEAASSSVDVLMTELLPSAETTTAAVTEPQSSSASTSVTATTTTTTMTTSSGGHSSSSTSALSSKLNMLLPGRRSNKQSKSASSLTPAASSHDDAEEKEGFWRKRRRNKSKSKADDAASSSTADDARSEASSRSDEPQTHDMPAIDEEGFSIRPSDVDPRRTPKWDGKQESDSEYSDSDEDEQTKKLKRLAIKAAAEADKKPVSDQELVAAVGKLSLGRTLGASMADALHRINEVEKESGDVDPWLPAAVSTTGKAVQLIRPALTGDAHMINTTFAGFGSANSQTARGPLQASLTGSTARARPRSNTPTSMFTVPRYSSMDATGAVGSGAPGSIHRADSLSSLGDPTGSGLAAGGMSRGVSLSSLSSVGLGSDVVPIAMAVNETVHAWFSSGDPQKADRVRVFGSVFVSFPKEYLPKLIVDDPGHMAELVPLAFKLCNAEKVNAIIPNKQVLSSEAKSQFASQGTHDFTFDASCLSAFLQKQRDAKPNMPFYNLEVLRYEVRKPVCAPLVVWSFWKCEPNQTDVRVDYKLNADSLIQVPLINLAFSTKISGAVNNDAVVSKPDAEWMGPSETLCWRLTELSRHGEREGSLKARLHVARGPSTPAQTNVKFTANDSTLSGVAVELASPSFKLSLLRRKVLSGKYFCEPHKPA